MPTATSTLSAQLHVTREATYRKILRASGFFMRRTRNRDNEYVIGVKEGEILRTGVPCDLNGVQRFIRKQKRSQHGEIVCVFSEEAAFGRQAVLSLLGAKAAGLHKHHIGMLAIQYAAGFHLAELYLEMSPTTRRHGGFPARVTIGHGVDLVKEWSPILHRYLQKSGFYPKFEHGFECYVFGFIRGIQGSILAQ